MFKENLKVPRLDIYIYIYKVGVRKKPIKSRKMEKK
jgi:hypothetical protein